VQQTEAALIAYCLFSPLCQTAQAFPALFGKSLVHDAAQCGHAAVIPILKDAGFDIDEFKNGRIGGYTPLMNAMEVGHSSREAVEALLKAGAWVGEENMRGESALTWARDHDLKEIALLLMQHGAPATPEIENWISEPDEQT
jgi:hypothetical protein